MMKIDSQTKKSLEQLAMRFLTENYNYVWLRAMLSKGRAISSQGATLVTGSSYALSGIREHCWKSAVNCSMSSQDLYYDFLCAQDVISSTGGGQKIEKCFLIVGYYAACHDLSSGTEERRRVIPSVYYPLFRDAHNWREPYLHDPWSGFGKLPPQVRLFCEGAAIKKILEYGTYYSPLRQRGGTVFDLKGRKWCDLPAEEKEALGQYRADCHNKLFQHKASITENKKILTEYALFLHINNIMPIFVIAPFTKVYYKYLLKDMKESVLELVDSVPEDIHFVDFNQCDLFDDSDFVDTDHLDEKGAEKMSKILVEMFGA